MKRKTTFKKDPEAFIQFLRNKDREIVEFGASSLIAAGEPVVEPVIRVLTDETEAIEVRRVAARVLSKIGEPALGPLLQVLKSKREDGKADPTTLGLVAAALGKMGEAALELLIQSLKDEHWEVRFGAAMALSLTGDVRAEQALLQAIKDEELDHVRRQVEKLLEGMRANTVG